MTRRERAEARLERRRDWAASRDAKAAAARRVGDEHRDPVTGRMDWALVTQPGHIPERARINRAHDRAILHGKMADHHESKAAGIERQLETTIFSDDPDAIEALEARISELESKRADRVAENKAARKAGKPAPWPSYSLSNLSGNTRRLRERVKFVSGRIAQLAKAAAAGGTLVEIVGFGVWDHARVTFEEFPGRATVDELKAAGFHWSDPSWWGKADNLPARLAGATEGVK